MIGSPLLSVPSFIAVIITLFEILTSQKTCYWVGHPLTKSGNVNRLVGEKEEYTWYEKVLMFAALLMGETVCFNGQEWIGRNIRNHNKRYFICEYDMGTYGAPPKQIVKPPFVFSRKSEAAVNLERHLFKELAPARTVCSRLCQRFPGCYVFSYNTVYGECRGHDKLEELSSDGDEELEVWVASWA